MNVALDGNVDMYAIMWMQEVNSDAICCFLYLILPYVHLLLM
jgi:hypothetical protein